MYLFTPKQEITSVSVHTLIPLQLVNLHCVNLQGPDLPVLEKSLLGLQNSQ